MVYLQRCASPPFSFSLLNMSICILLLELSSLMLPILTTVCHFRLTTSNPFSDNSSNYYLTGSEFTCDFLPSFHPSGSIDLDTCKAIHLYGEELCAFFLFRVLQQLKKGDVRVKLEGRGIDCSPVDGISMVAISTTGVPIPCKAYVGHRDGTGIISCSYSCSCSAGCIMFRVVFTDPTNKVICAFHV